jgi:glycosyltransferase involved in cell wall biosynthesis
MPTVSVIIPAHRWDNFVAEAIVSVQQQTLPVWEIIVANDGAGETINRPLRENFSTVKIAELQKNSGDAATRNAGAAIASGEWLAFLDADDVWLPQKLERQFAALQQHPDWDGSYTGVTVFNKTGDIGSYCDKPEILTIDELLICTHALPSCILIRRCDFESLGGFDTGYRNASDHDFFIRYALSGKKMGFVAEPLLRFRRAGQGNISSNWRRVLKGKTRLFRIHKSTFLRYGGWCAPFRFYGHVFGECAAKTRFSWQRRLLWSFAKILLLIGGVNWRKDAAS